MTGTPSLQRAIAGAGRARHACFEAPIESPEWSLVIRSPLLWRPPLISHLSLVKAIIINTEQTRWDAVTTDAMPCAMAAVSLTITRSRL